MDDVDSTEISLTTPSPIPLRLLRDHLNSLHNLREQSIEFSSDSSSSSPLSPMVSLSPSSLPIDYEFDFIEDNSHFFYPGHVSGHEDRNKAKNRYGNVIALEDTRVKLIGKSDDESDYINANYISTSEDEKFYIATQGPLKSTILDFWMMIWSENINTIVMLTRLVESGREKCDQYWPEDRDNPLVFGSIQILLLEEGGDKQIIVRRFQITTADFPKNPRTVIHFQYVEWPDHRLPSCTAQFRKLLKLVDSEYESHPSTILVHCSAGIGRTGTFCAVHSILRGLKRQKDDHQSSLKNDAGGVNDRNFVCGSKEKSICLPEVVLKLRNDRQGMVQTKDQYLFCYQAVLEELEEHPEEFGLTLEEIGHREKQRSTNSIKNLDQDRLECHNTKGTPVHNLTSTGGSNTSFSFVTFNSFSSSSDSCLTPPLASSPEMKSESSDREVEAD